MQPLRLVTYNVRYFGHGTRGLASTRGAMQRVARAIVDLDPLPDVVCLQEVETSSLRSTIAHPARTPGETQLNRFVEHVDALLAAAGRRIRYEAYYFPAHRYAGPLESAIYTTGLAVLARSDLAVEHHNAGEPVDITCRHLHPVRRFKQTRICAHVRIRDRAGHDLDVFNTHLSLPSTLSRAFWTERERLGFGPNQLEEARAVSAFVTREKASDRFVVVGDFNALPGSPVYRHMVDEAGLADAYANSLGLDTDALKKVPTAGFMAMRMRIDHVFSGPGLHWLGFEDTHAFGRRGGRFHGLSDHVPLVGRFRPR